MSQDDILRAVADLWCRNPSLRFGQLVPNAACLAGSTSPNVEDERFLQVVLRQIALGD